MSVSQITTVRDGFDIMVSSFWGCGMTSWNVSWVPRPCRLRPIGDRRSAASPSRRRARRVGLRRRRSYRARDGTCSCLLGRLSSTVGGGGPCVVCRLADVGVCREADLSAGMDLPCG
jgi:hypothetical protein